MVPGCKLHNNLIALSRARAREGLWINDSTVAGEF